MTAHTPAVSVVMPVRNAGPYVDRAIASILRQTFDDLELVVLDDASSDDTGERLRIWAGRDRRVRVIASSRPLGLSGSSNAVVSHARAPVLARMDGDDESEPERLARELTVLEEHEDAALVGTLFVGIDADDRTVRPRDRWRVIRRSGFAPFPHGSVMFRRAAFEAVGGYRQACRYWEDLDLYYRLAGRGRLLVLPEALYRYRFHDGSSRLSVGAEDERTERISLGMRCARVRRTTGSYESLLAGASNGDHGGDALRDALYVMAATRFWAGRRPDLMRPLVELRPRPSPLQPRTLGVLAFAAWGSLHHPSLRVAMRMLVGGRDRLAGLYVRDRRVYEWRFA